MEGGSGRSEIGIFCDMARRARAPVCIDGGANEGMSSSLTVVTHYDLHSGVGGTAGGVSQD